MTYFKPGFALWIVIIISSVAGCGSAEAIKAYHYPTTKYTLEKAVRKVISTNTNIYHDNAQENKLDSIMEKARREQSKADSSYYYNDGKFHVTIKITSGEVENSYIFRYYGEEQYWKESSTAGILLVSAHDKYGNGFLQGHNENQEFKSKNAKELTAFFESEFIQKVDAELSLKHTVIN